MKAIASNLAIALLLLLSTPWLALGQDVANTIAIPHEDAQAKSTKLIKEVYGDEFAKARTSAEKQILAKMLFEKAGQTSDDPVSQYVLLKLVIHYSIQSSDMQRAFQAIGLMEKKFEVDVIELKAAALTELAPLAKKPELSRSHAEEAIKLVDLAVRQGNFAVADSIGKIALSEARKSRDKELIALAKGKIADAAEMNQASDEMKAARVVLQDTPADPNANLTLGRYLCVVKDDWEKGLPMLVIGSDADLSMLGKEELRGPTTPAEQVQLADAWWNAAEEQKGILKKSMQVRAGHWYQKALPQLTGVTSDRATTRIERVIRLGASPQKLNGKWFLIFRSADPAVWNTESPDANRFAIPLAKVPDDIKYLKMQLDPKTSAIIEMSKSRIGTVSSDARYGWEGTNQVVWGGRQLGIFDKSIIIGQQSYAGGPCIWWDNGGFSGCGFGYIPGANVQGCGWNGKAIGQTTFEIYVTSDNLSKAERESLLK